MTTDPSVFFRDMLGQWEKMANSFGGEAMKSEEFARGMHTANAATMTMQAALQQQTERALAAANIPTRTDIDALAARIASVEATLLRIEAKLDGAPPKPKLGPTRGRKPVESKA